MQSLNTVPQYRVLLFKKYNNCIRVHISKHAKYCSLLDPYDFTRILLAVGPSISPEFRVTLSYLTAEGNGGRTCLRKYSRFIDSYSDFLYIPLRKLKFLKLICFKRFWENMSQGIIFTLLLFTGRGISSCYANAVLFSLLRQLLYVYRKMVPLCLIWICLSAFGVCC